MAQTAAWGSSDRKLPAPRTRAERLAAAARHARQRAREQTLQRADSAGSSEAGDRRERSSTKWKRRGSAATPGARSSLQWDGTWLSTADLPERLEQVTEPQSCTG